MDVDEKGLNFDQVEFQWNLCATKTVLLFTGAVKMQKRVSHETHAKEFFVTMECGEKNGNCRIIKKIWNNRQQSQKNYVFLSFEFGLVHARFRLCLSTKLRLSRRILKSFLFV